MEKYLIEIVKSLSLINENITVLNNRIDKIEARLSNINNNEAVNMISDEINSMNSDMIDLNSLTNSLKLFFEENGITLFSQLYDREDEIKNLFSQFYFDENDKMIFNGLFEGIIGDINDGVNDLKYKNVLEFALSSDSSIKFWSALNSYSNAESSDSDTLNLIIHSISSNIDAFIIKMKDLVVKRQDNIEDIFSISIDQVSMEILNKISIETEDSYEDIILKLFGI